MSRCPRREFLRGAARSRGGVPIIALPSTAGRASRIVVRLNGPVALETMCVGGGQGVAAVFEAP